MSVIRKGSNLANGTLGKVPVTLYPAHLKGRLMSAHGYLEKGSCLSIRILIGSCLPMSTLNTLPIQRIRGEGSCLPIGTLKQGHVCLYVHGGKVHAHLSVPSGKVPVCLWLHWGKVNACLPVSWGQVSAPQYLERKVNVCLPVPWGKFHVCLSVPIN